MGRTIKRRNLLARDMWTHGQYKHRVQELREDDFDLDNEVEEWYNSDYEEEDEDVSR
jgi:hypothetical protein